MTEATQKLQAPGAGLPPLENWIFKNIAFPLGVRLLSWDKAMAQFQAEGKTILALAEPLSDEKLLQPVLIKRIPGMEDSSRNWSVAMAMKHLIIVGEMICDGIVKMSQGEKIAGKADTAAVKPDSVKSRQILSDFSHFLSDYAFKLKGKGKNLSLEEKYEHPWFGFLNAYEWACLAGIHQGLHRRQIQAILKQLH